MRIALLLLVALTSCRSWDAKTARLANLVEESRLKRHVESLVSIGPRPARNRIATRQTLEYLRKELTSYGYSVEQEQFEWQELEVFNLFATLHGSKPGPTLEVGAHYDTVPGSPGADDNASGVAGVLEVARVLAKQELTHSVRFCLFGAEEVGLVGSRYHAREIAKNPDAHLGIFVLEMIGFTTSADDSQLAPIRIPFIAWLPRTGNFLCVVGNLRSGSLGHHFERSIDLYTPDLPYYSANRIGGFFSDASRSDHSPYWDVGRRGIMVTDTANFRNPHYHRPSDGPETLDYDFMARVTQATVATVLYLQNRE